MITLPPTLRFMMGVEQAHPRAIDAMLERAIAELDEIEGDPDFEDSTDAEDEFSLSETALDWGRWQGVGCPISDPGGGAVDDEGEAIDEREEDEGAIPAYGIDQTEGPIPCDWRAERAALRYHRDRIRRTRCRKIVYDNKWSGRRHVQYRLNRG